MTGARQHADEPALAVEAPAAAPAPGLAPVAPAVEAPAAAPAPGLAPVAALTPATILRLQAGAGNRAVTRRLLAGVLARQPAPAQTGPPAPTGTPPPAPVADVPGRSRVVAPPDPTRGVAAGDDGVHPAVDVAADANNVTVSLVLRNFNLPQSGDTSTIDFLHEPSASIQVTPGTPNAVAQAAIAALNVHLRRHGRDLVELSLSPQVSSDPKVSLQAQAELHVTASFSMTAATAVSAGPSGGTPDPGTVPLPSPDRRVDLSWSPISIGVLFHLDAPERGPDRGPGLDYDALRSDAALINWVVNQLDRGDFASRGAGQLEVSEFVTQLLDVMRNAGGGEAQWAIHLGVLQVGDIPAGLTRGLTRAAQLIAGANRQAAGVSQVRVSMFNLPPSGEGGERVVRWTLLPVAGQSVTPAAAP